MTHLDDQTILSYIDGELDPEMMRTAEIHVKQCGECAAKIAAQRRADHYLKTQKTEFAPANFARDFMQRLNVPSRIVQKNYFFRIIFTIFVLSIAAIMIFVMANMPDTQGGGLTGVWMDIINGSVGENLKLYEKFLFSRSISVSAAVFTAISFISIYFAYDSYRKARNRLKSL